MGLCLCLPLFFISCCYVAAGHDKGGDRCSGGGAPQPHPAAVTLTFLPPPSQV